MLQGAIEPVDLANRIIADLSASPDAAPSSRARSLVYYKESVNG